MRIFKCLALVFALLVAAIPIQAQTTTTSTILSAAITTANATNITVASATGFTAGTTAVYIDGEYMLVNTVSGTTMGVTRGAGGTTSRTHLTNSLVWVGPRGNAGPFGTFSPSGRCVASQEAYLPRINILEGEVWNCASINSAINNSPVGTTGGSAAVQVWQSASLVGWVSVFPYRTVTNAAYTATLTDTIVDYNSMTAARTLTLPAVTGIYGKLMIVKHSVNNQTLTVAASSGQYITTVGTASMTLTAGQSTILLSAGGGWVTVGGLAGAQ